MCPLASGWACVPYKELLELEELAAVLSVLATYGLYMSLSYTVACQMIVCILEGERAEAAHLLKQHFWLVGTRKAQPIFQRFVLRLKSENI